MHKHIQEILIQNQSQFVEGNIYIKSDGKKEELVLGRDMEVVEGSYVKNVKKGKAKVTFKGKVGTLYGGTKTVTFNIGQHSVLEELEALFASL